MTDGARTDDLQAQWARVRGRLKEEYGDTTYRSWLKAMTLFGIEDGKVRIGVPTRFLREWVSRHYADRIRALWNGENDSITAVEILVTGCAMAQPAETEPAAAGAAAHSGREADSGAADEKDVGAPLDPRFTFENFVVGKPNELAHAAARRVAEAQVGVNRAVPFNPLFLYGGVGLGKTHLMHAIAWHIRTNDPSRKVIYLSAEKFMYQFIRAIRFRDTMAFKDQFRSVDALMVDDLQFIGGRDATQEEFFHTFNALVDHNRQIIISADKSPSDLEGIEERVKSRLAWGLVADVHPTNYELRLSILQNKADASRFKIAVKVLEFLAHKITSEQAEEALRAILRANERKVSIDEIQQRVAAHYNIRLADMHSARRQLLAEIHRHLAGPSHDAGAPRRMHVGKADIVMLGDALLDLVDADLALIGPQDGAERLFRLLDGDLATAEPRMGIEQVQGTFELADVRGDLMGEEFQHLDGDLEPAGIRLVLQDRQPQLVVRRVDVGYQAPGEARLDPLLDAFEVRGGFVGGDDDLPVMVDQGIESMEEFFLGGVAEADGADELVHELLGREIDHLAARIVRPDVPGDGMHEMGLAEPHAAIKKERVEGHGAIDADLGLGDAPGGGMGE